MVRCWVTGSAPPGAGVVPEVAASGRSVTLEGLDAEARRLWETLPPGGVVWLTGEIGTGKTSFVQALARVGGAERARSPSFALVHEYPSPHGPLIHADCYRLRRPDEALDLDFPGLERRARLLMVEWPERAGSEAPPPTAHLHFAYADEPSRRIVRRVL